MKKTLIPIFLISLFLTSCNKNKVEEITVIKLVETTKSWNGDKLPNYLEGNPKITILKITIPPNTILETHKHLEINAGVLLKGKLTVISEQNDTLYLNAGDPIVELVNTWNYGKNESKIPAEIIVFYAGVEGTPITVIKD